MGTRVLGSIFGRVYRPSAKMTHLWLSKFFFFAIFVISSEAKARVNFEAVPDNCKSCIKDVMHAFEVCREAGDHHPKEFFQCVQDVLRATSKCLECVCDIIKAIKPDFPCTSGEIISFDDMDGGLFCYNDHDCPHGWHCIGAIPPFIPGICVPLDGGDDNLLEETEVDCHCDTPLEGAGNGNNGWSCTDGYHDYCANDQICYSNGYFPKDSPACATADQLVCKLN